MSAENVEIVRAYFEGVGLFLSAYWDNSEDYSIGFAETAEAETAEGRRCGR